VDVDRYAAKKNQLNQTHSTDTKTGFMWMKEDSYQYKGHWLNWFEAFDYVKVLNEKRFADYLDWRLPTVNELTTLYEAEKFNGKQVGREMNLRMDPIFAKEGSGTLWTVESNGNYNAFGVVFNTGQRFNSSKRKKASVYNKRKCKYNCYTTKRKTSSKNVRESPLCSPRHTLAVCLGVLIVRYNKPLFT